MTEREKRLPYENGHPNGHDTPATLLTAELYTTHPTLTATATTHVDPIWKWEKSNGLNAFKATAKAAVSLAEQNPEMTFAFSSARLFKHVEDVDPETFEGLAELVKQGRLEPVGGMWVEPDEYMPSGPGFYRQLLEGQEYFAKKFGRTAKTAWSPDAWGGRPRSLPSMLKDAELEYLIYKRPEDHQIILPRTHRWVADNGDEVLVYHIHEYGTWRKGLPRHMRRVVRDMREPNIHGLGLYGAGNHGGGATQENVDQLNEYVRDPQVLLPDCADLQVRKAFTVSHGLPEQFFNRVSKQKKQLPIFQGDVPSPSQGDYASHSRVKAENRGAENNLLDAEALSSMYVMSSHQPEKRVYPSVPIKTAWQDVLEHQFHDTSAGTSIPEAYVAVMQEYGRARANANEASMLAMQRIANDIDIPVFEGQERVTFPIVVFNPTGHEVAQFVTENTIDPEMFFQTGDITMSHMLIDEEGNEVPFQSVMADSNPYPRVGFTARLHPGYRVYRMVPKPQGYEEQEMEGVKMEDLKLENDRYEIEFDHETGAIKTFYDKEHDLAITNGLTALPLVFHDPANAWGQEAYRDPVENASYLPIAIARKHEGPLMSSIQVDYVLKRNGEKTGSTLSQEFIMYKDLPQIDVRVHSYLDQSKIAVKLAFPVAIKTYPEATYDIPYASTIRPIIDKEAPGQSWVDVSGESDYNVNGERVLHGLTIASDAKYSFSSKYEDSKSKTTLYMMVSRSGSYTETPTTPKEEFHQRYLDVGEPQEFTYSLTPHLDTWREAATHRKGIEINRPLRTLPEAPHKGKLPMVSQVVAIDRENIVLEEIKKAEDGTGIIVRLNEKYQQTTHNVQVTLYGRTFTVDFKPHDVKTILIPFDIAHPIHETNALEKVF